MAICKVEDTHRSYSKENIISLFSIHYRRDGIIRCIVNRDRHHGVPGSRVRYLRWRYTNKPTQMIENGYLALRAMFSKNYRTCSVKPTLQANTASIIGLQWRIRT